MSVYSNWRRGLRLLWPQPRVATSLS